MLNKLFDNPQNAPFSMDLQLFAEEPKEPKKPLVNPLLAVEEEERQAEDLGTELQPARPEQALEDEAERTEPDQEELYLGKFKSPEDMARAYQNLEAFNTQTRQELAQARHLLENQQVVIRQLQNQVQLAQNPAQADEVWPEDIESRRERFMEDFYEDPEAALGKILEKTVGPRLQPLQEKFEEDNRRQLWNQRVDDFSARTEDLDQWKEAMAQVLVDNPELRYHPKALEIAYNMAKGMQYQDPNSLAQDEDFINRVMGNKDIRKKIIQEHMQGVMDNQPPTVLSGQPGGDSIPAPSEKPRTIQDATKQLMQQWGLRK